MDSVLRLIFAYYMTRYIVNRAYKKQSLSSSGRYAAFVVGIFVTWSSFCNFAALITFFVVCSKATKYKQDFKKKFEENFKENGQRDALQVICNGFFPTLFASFYIADCGVGERAIDFNHNYKASMYSLAILSAICCCCGDTLASEIGTVCSESSINRTIHIFKWKRVPKGTNGGVSLCGTLASVFGGFIVALAYYLVLSFNLYLDDAYRPDAPIQMPPQWPILLIGTLSGFFGSLIDSMLGAKWQYSGYNIDTECIVETPGPNVKHISGKFILNNHQVNVFSTLITLWAVPVVSCSYYRIF